jgi:hypothetical protein
MIRRGKEVLTDKRLAQVSKQLLVDDSDKCHALV